MKTVEYFTRPGLPTGMYTYIDAQKIMKSKKWLKNAVIYSIVQVIYCDIRYKQYQQAKNLDYRKQ